MAKNIYYSNKDLAHMVLSVKPFGCMPSTQSDGAQAAVVSHYKDMIYLPIETSGEGEVNAHSRVQMALGEAKNKAKREFAEALDRHRHDAGRTARRSWTSIPKPSGPCTTCPHTKGIVGVAANFALHIAERAKKENWTPKVRVPSGRRKQSEVSLNTERTDDGMRAEFK